MRHLMMLLLCLGPAYAIEEEIKADTRLPEGLWRLERPLRVVADGVTLDLAGAELAGPQADGDPDGFTGFGIVVEGRRKVTIRGGRLRGFRCAVLVKDCEEVVLDGIDVSGNFRQRLRSTPEREAVSDWLRPHDNDRQEWRKRYGAGICLENCRRCVVKGCTGRRQQNGILLDRCTGCEVYDNDMSFNSGWGVALWRSSRNVVSRNSLDWCVRGYSHGVYDRGQDSAGILVFEQCHDNVFFKNSATHGGDGFFLYAGEETLKRTGEGGCNGNLVLNNDFSHAVANAIEATFSGGNRFVGNRCDDSNYGVWAGYSYGSLVEGNTFTNNRIAGVAIEHGTKNTVVYNTFHGNARGVWLWWDDDKELLASRFADKHPCASREYLIALNSFLGDKVGVSLRDTSGVALRGNHFEDVGEALRRAGDCADVTVEEEAPVFAGFKDDRDFPGERDAFLAAGHPRGMRHIMVDEWGPLDPKATSVFPRRAVAWGECVFFVLGPEAEYEVAGLPEGLTVEKGPRKFRVTGRRGLTPFTGEVRAGGGVFPIEGVLLNARWQVRFHAWKGDPRESEAWRGTEPLDEGELDRLDFVWAMGAPSPKVPRDHFVTRAATTMELPAGRYELRTVSDDGVRVLVDGKVVQEDWTWHGPKENRSEVELGEGRHEIVVEHFEIDGYAVLRFDLRPLK